MNLGKTTMASIAASAMASAMVYANLFSNFKFTNNFPAPRRIKSIVSFYNSNTHGTFKNYNYKTEKGIPRPSWTYRAARRNVGRNLLTKAA
jgi:hypothetical protein